MEVPQSAAGSRRAALLVHALPANDRAWLLDALSPAERGAIQKLLAELQTLDIPPDPTLLDLENSAAAAKPQAAELLGRLNESQLEALAALLQKEPPALTARLLAMRPWSWSDALLQRCEMSFVRRVHGVASPPTAPALNVAICEAVLTQLRAAPVKGAARPALRELVRRCLPRNVFGASN